MNTSVYNLSALKSVSSLFHMPFAVVVEFEYYDSYQFTGGNKQAYQRAYRFERLLERGYSPKMAYKLATVGICPTLKTFQREFDGSAHDKLTDEIPPFIPVGYEVEEFSIDELATCELNEIYNSWLRDGGEALFLASDELSVSYTDLRAYVTGRAQTEDMSADNWTTPHHSMTVQY